MGVVIFFVLKQKTAYEMRISDWSSDVCSSDLLAARSRHPLCRALIAACPDAEPAGDVEEMPGAGLRRRTTAGEWRLGHARFAGAEIGRASCRERVCQYV